MSLQDDIEYLKARLFALEDRVKTSPHFRWGTVVTSVPLTIILDGAAHALPGTPANAGPKVLMAGERVRVELQGNRAVVHAVGGRVEDLRGTTAQRVALAMSGAAVEGMRFYDTDENREYVWQNSAWFGSTDWVTVAPDVGAGTVSWKSANRIVFVTWEGTGSYPVGATTLKTGLIPPAYLPSVNQRGSGALNANAAAGLYVTAGGVIGIMNSTGGTRTGGEGSCIYMI